MFGILVEEDEEEKDLCARRDIPYHAMDSIVGGGHIYIPEAKPSRKMLVYFFSLNARRYIYGFCVLLKRRKNATNRPIGNKLTVRNFIIYSPPTIGYVVAAIVYIYRENIIQKI